MPEDPPYPSERWASLIEEFQSFGGTAINIVQREGEFGLGLFPIDPSKPVELRSPKNLLVPTNNIILKNGNIVIKNDERFPPGYADWYERFQSDFSWGAEAKHSIQSFEEGLRSLPKDCLLLLKKFGFYVSSDRYPQGKEIDGIFQRFILTRQINWQGNTYLMPIIELINHSARYQSWGVSNNGIHIEGQFDGEILVRYSIADPLIRLIQYGFNCREPMCFSTNQRLIHNNRTVLVIGGINNEVLKPFKIENRENKYIFDRPILSHSLNPKLPRKIFNESLKNYKWVNTDELFEQIHMQNNLALIKILKSLHGAQGDVSIQLTNACLDQLEILRHRY